MFTDNWGNRTISSGAEKEKRELGEKNQRLRQHRKRVFSHVFRTFFFPLFSPRVGHVTRHCSDMFLLSASQGWNTLRRINTGLGQHMSESIIYRLTLVASLSGFLFGYDTGYISAVLVSVGTGLGGSELSHKQAEYISSATSFGALIAALFAGMLADVYGRRVSIMLCDVLFVIGACVQVIATNVSAMVIGRLIMGFAVGIGSLCAPLYISEMAPSKIRGRLVTTNCLAITGGQLIAYAIGALFTRLHNGWRLIIGLSLIPCVAQFILMNKLPESPRYLISISELDNAAYLLRQIYPYLCDTEIQDMIIDIQDSNSMQTSETTFSAWKAAYLNLFSNKANLRGLTIACGLQFFQQFVGFNALMYYSSTIFNMVGFHNSTAVSCFIAGTNMLFTIIAMFIIDKVGRRRMLLFSIPLLFLSQLATSFAFQYNGRYMLLVSLISFVAFYAIGLGNVPWQQSELFPQNVRGAGSSLATATNWFGSMTVSFFFLTLVKNISASLTFLLFSTVSTIAFIFVYYTYPELSGLPLEKVQELLNDGFNVQKSVELYHGYNSISN